MEGETHFIEQWTLDGKKTYTSVVMPIEKLVEFLSITHDWIGGYTIAIFYIKPKQIIL